MFRFLFKRADRAAPQTVIESQTVLRSEARQMSDQARQQALIQAQALTEEAAAVAFILQSAFADARLCAAQRVQSRDALQNVLQACRNTDRRVAKLMQGRLDNMRRQQLIADKAAGCVAQAQCLLREPQLMPNQVAELDRTWNPKDVQPELKQQFTQIRDALVERLTAQTNLQRTVIGLLNSARDMHQQVNTEMLADNRYAQYVEELDTLEVRMGACSNHAEAVTLPRHLAIDFAQEVRTLRKRLLGLQHYQSALQARDNLLTKWEATTGTLNPDNLKTTWSTLPELPAALINDALEQRYQVLLKQHTGLIALQRSQTLTPVTATELPQIAEALDGLEKALENGSLQVAMDFDKVLRAIDFKVQKPNATQNTRLMKARSELSRLQGWARWGGNVSREELTKAAQELQGQSLAPAELAKKIGSLRARWKSLDSTSGSASKVLWEGFDTACTDAYAPVQAYFQQQAEQRQVNQANARALIAEVQQYAQSALPSDGAAEMKPNWKAIARFCQEKQQAWRNLGTINRSEKKTFDSTFATTLNTLLTPLAVQQQIEITRREKLIAEATELPSNRRDTVDHVRELQHRWQEQANALPLPRQAEQELWQRFRAACDAIFVQRKEAASSADTERRNNLRVREEQCALLEAAVNQPEATLQKTLQQVKHEWLRGGQVPRAMHAQIEARFQSAVAGVQAILDKSLRNAALVQADALRDKLILCQKIEASIGNADSAGNERELYWRSHWQTLPALTPVFEKIIGARFERALKSDDEYAASLENNRPALLQELLRAEILAGIDSPAAWSRERLKLQVEVLQAALKMGASAKNIEPQLLHICRLPALMDEEALERLLKLIMLMIPSFQLNTNRNKAMPARIDL